MPRLVLPQGVLQSAIGPDRRVADDGNVPLPDDFKLKLSAAINAIA